MIYIANRSSAIYFPYDAELLEWLQADYKQSDYQAPA